MHIGVLAGCSLLGWQSGNSEWLTKHRETIEQICDKQMPSGSGIDCGTKLDFNRSKPNRLIFLVSYHHMNDGGMYNGWTEHEIIVTPDLASDFAIRITGKDRNNIKDYLGDIYRFALGETFNDKPKLDPLPPGTSLVADVPLMPAP